VPADRRGGKRSELMMAFLRSAALRIAPRGVSISAILYRAAAVLGFVGLIALGAHLKIALPYTPVPVTFQTFFVLLAGAILGPAEGVAAVTLYLAGGALGVPFFARPGISGLAYFTGITGGYLFGFIAASVIVGIGVRRTQRLAAQALLFAAAALLILGCGTAWLYVIGGRALWPAVMAGLVPFLAGDTLKAGAALFAYRALRMAVPDKSDA